jgi:hypothetical protein
MQMLIELEESPKMSTIDRHILKNPGSKMKASIVDLRYKTREILKALERNESVTVLYHGKVKGVIHPAGNKPVSSVADHPFFGMHGQATETVEEEMHRLRKPRHDV